MSRLVFAGLASSVILLASLTASLAGQTPPQLTDQDIINQLKLQSGDSRGLGHIDHLPSTSKVVQSAYGVGTAKNGAKQAVTSDTVSSGQGVFAAPILFDLNSAQIKPESAGLLNQISRAMSSPELKDAKIEVQGHTDRTGTPDFNKELSEKRAMAVRDYLVANGGISADRLTAIGKGDTELAVPDAPTAPENRRVLLVNRGS